MNDTAIIDWKTLTITACGIAIGWVFSQLSSWWSNRGQRQRTKRRMLFYLLELEYLIARMDVEEGADHLIQFFRSKVGDEFSAKDEAMMREQVRPLLARVVLDQSADEVSDLEEGYHSAVEELSYIAPFIAYRLKGRTRLFRRFDVVRDLLEKAPSLDPTMTPPQMTAVADVFNTLKPDLIKQDLEVVRDELVSLSWRVGPVAVWKAKRRIARSSFFTDDDRKDMEDFLEQYMQALMDKYPNGI